MKTKILILGMLCLSGTISATCPAVCEKAPDPAHVYILMYLPVALFLLFVGVIGYWLATGKVKVKNLLMEKKVPPPAVPPVAMPDAAEPDPPSSTSRILLLLSGIIAIAISVCYFASMIYLCSIGAADSPSWGDMGIMLTSLGLGVVPYMAKQFFK